MIDDPERKELNMLALWLTKVKTEFGDADEEDNVKPRKKGDDDEFPDIVVTGAGEELINGEYVKVLWHS